MSGLVLDAMKDSNIVSIERWGGGGATQKRWCLRKRVEDLLQKSGDPEILDFWSKIKELDIK